MPDSKVTVEAAFAKDGTAVDQPLFSDVSKNNYFYDAVEWAVDKGITSGTGGTTFSPNASCTRGQMVTFLCGAAGSPRAQECGDPLHGCEPRATTSMTRSCGLWSRGSPPAPVPLLSAPTPL